MDAAAKGPAAHHGRVAFDLYGTLLDVAGLGARLVPHAGPEAPALLQRWRAAQLERTWELNRLGRFQPWDEVTAQALAQVAPQLSATARARMCTEWLTLPAFADARAALEALGEAGVRRTVLSNGTRAMIRSALDAAGLPIDDLLSAEDVRAYKTDPRVYALLQPRQGSLFASSNAWDVEGAKRSGLTVAWIDRGGPAPGTAPDRRVDSLQMLAEAVLGAPGKEPLFDVRYRAPGYLFGTEPNTFLAAEAHRIRRGGRVLSLGEGEGRNAVFLAAQGLEVIALDASAVGLSKAEELARGRGVRIAFQVCDLATAPFPPGLDAVISIFCHLPAAERRAVHRRALEALAPGGLFLAELYRPEQLRFRTGGPREAGRLATLADLREDLAGAEELLGRELVREVVEGSSHTGEAATVQVVFRKR